VRRGSKSGSRRLGSRLALPALSLLLLSGVLHAQAASRPQEIPQTTAPDTEPTTGPDTGAKPPSLQKRSPTNRDGEPDAGTDAGPRLVAATGHTDMPPESEGRYPWDKHGGEIELYFEGGQLNGYMTEHVDPDPHVAAVTYRFTTTHVDEHALAFATQEIHGVFYNFSGHLERGVSASPELPGYYLLTGTLVRHANDSEDFKQTVSLKRLPGQ